MSASPLMSAWTSAGIWMLGRDTTPRCALGNKDIPQIRARHARGEEPPELQFRGDHGAPPLVLCRLEVHMVSGFGTEWSEYHHDRRAYFELISRFKPLWHEDVDDLAVVTLKPQHISRLAARWDLNLELRIRPQPVPNDAGLLVYMRNDLQVAQWPTRDNGLAGLVVWRDLRDELTWFHSGCLEVPPPRGAKGAIVKRSADNFLAIDDGRVGRQMAHVAVCTEQWSTYEPLGVVDQGPISICKLLVARAVMPEDVHASCRPSLDHVVATAD
mmetsp:Transcript_109472/g.316447  ORF Transcript_109472/g.316447 Transcript_109472/m.316447 type:complete len:271 (-) Transcript_109472:83-895(-)